MMGIELIPKFKGSVYEFMNSSPFALQFINKYFEFKGKGIRVDQIDLEEAFTKMPEMLEIGDLYKKLMISTVNSFKRIDSKEILTKFFKQNSIFNQEEIKETFTITHETTNGSVSEIHICTLTFKNIGLSSASGATLPEARNNAYSKGIYILYEQINSFESEDVIQLLKAKKKKKDHIDATAHKAEVTHSL